MGFKLRLAVIIASIVVSVTVSLPEYKIQIWDKNGGLLISGGQSPHGNQSQLQYSRFWCHDVDGFRTRVSNNTILNLYSGYSEYDEYYLLDEPSQSIVEYVLVVPNSNGGKLSYQYYE